jgi:hypothetical protein
VEPAERLAAALAMEGEELFYIEQLGVAVVTAPRELARARCAACEAVTEDTVLAAQETEIVPLREQWGIFGVRAPVTWPETAKGVAEVVVAVVDTGVNPHPDLALVGGYNAIADNDDAADDNGHGTRMAGIIAGHGGIIGMATTNTVILPIKVLNEQALGFESVIARGVVEAVDRGARIINVSLAGPAYPAVLKLAVDYALAQGVVVVAAAGNSGSGEPWYPAALAGVIAVGATTASDRPASFSNHGRWLSFVAPGWEVATTDRNGGYTTTTGTSPATAFVSGALALLTARGLRPHDARQLLQESAHDIGPQGWDEETGWGRIDVGAAVGIPPPARPDRRRPRRVTIVAPRQGERLGETVAVEVATTNDVVAVELVVNRTTIARDSAPPFTFQWQPSTSPAYLYHLLQAIGYDAAGNRRRSPLVVIRVRPRDTR